MSQPWPDFHGMPEFAVLNILKEALCERFLYPSRLEHSLDPSFPEFGDSKTDGSLRYVMTYIDNALLVHEYSSIFDDYLYIQGMLPLYSGFVLKTKISEFLNCVESNRITFENLENKLNEEIIVVNDLKYKPHLFVDWAVQRTKILDLTVKRLFTTDCFGGVNIMFDRRGDGYRYENNKEWIYDDWLGNYNHVCVDSYTFGDNGKHYCSASLPTPWFHDQHDLFAELKCSNVKASVICSHRPYDETDYHKFYDFGYGIQNPAEECYFSAKNFTMTKLEKDTDVPVPWSGDWKTKFPNSAFRWPSFVQGHNTRLYFYVHMRYILLDFTDNLTYYGQA